MTDAQLYIAVGLPVVAVLSSLVISMFQISGVREDIRGIRSYLETMTGKIAEIDTRLSVIEDRLGR